MMVAFISVNIFKYFRWEIDMLGNVFSVCDSFTPKVFNILRLPFFDSSASSTSSSGKISKYFTCSLIYKANVVCFGMSAFLLFSWHWFLLSGAPVGEVLGFENLVMSVPVPKSPPFLEVLHSYFWISQEFKSTSELSACYFKIPYKQDRRDSVPALREVGQLCKTWHLVLTLKKGQMSMWDGQSLYPLMGKPWVNAWTPESSLGPKSLHCESRTRFPCGDCVPCDPVR